MLTNTELARPGLFPSEWACSPAGLAGALVPPESDFRLTVHPENGADRQVAQSLIQSVYAAAYGAHIHSWMPVLLSLCKRGRMVAAAGYRSGLEPLYLEHYLDAPIEQLLQGATSATLERRQIVEVGHFSAVTPGGGRALIPRLGPHLRGQGFTWAVSTVGGPLYAMLRRAGYTPVPLASADPLRLNYDERDNWGTYYSSKPVVVAIDLYTPKALELAHDDQ